MDERRQVKTARVKAIIGINTRDQLSVAGLVLITHIPEGEATALGGDETPKIY